MSGKTDYAGIDYSLGKSNHDDKGFHYGVIHQNEVLQAWADDSEGYYGDPCCPKCGGKVIASDEYESEEPDQPLFDELDNPAFFEPGKDYCCPECKEDYWSENVYPDEALSYYIDDEEYTAECSDCVDIFITKSPYYTKAQFCSPCAPGAGYLMSPCESGPKTYCFGHDWFEDNVAPYPVYRVDNDELVEPENKGT